MRGEHIEVAQCICYVALRECVASRHGHVTGLVFETGLSSRWGVGAGVELGTAGHVIGAEGSVSSAGGVRSGSGEVHSPMLEVVVGTRV